MKIRVLSMLFGSLFHLSCAVTLLHAQGPVSTGTVQDISREDGILRLRSEQSGSGPIIYYGMDKADILTVAGKPAKLADLTPGMQVSVFYAKQNDRWVVSKILIPDSPAAPTVVGSAATAPVAETGKANRDGDRTTRGPNSAAIDGDRTTVPADRNANRDGDRTTRAPNSAAVDGDRTTVPAEGSSPVRRSAP